MLNVALMMGEIPSNILMYVERELGQVVLLSLILLLWKALSKRGEKSWIVNICLSRFPYQEKVMLKYTPTAGRTCNTTMQKKNPFFEVQYTHLCTFLLTISYVFFSLGLDIEEYESFTQFLLKK